MKHHRKLAVVLLGIAVLSGLLDADDELGLRPIAVDFSTFKTYAWKDVETTQNAAPRGAHQERRRFHAGDERHCTRSTATRISGSSRIRA